MRLNKAYIEARFERISELLAAENLEWRTGPLWTRDESGINRANIGAVYLDNVPIYGGWGIHQIVNEHGGRRDILPHRMKPSELDAWFSGVEFGFAAVDRGE